MYGDYKNRSGQSEEIWKNRSFTKATKIGLMRTLVFPIYLYAGKMWTWQQVQKKMVDGMWCWRRMLVISWTELSTNVSILQEVGIKQALSLLVHGLILSFFLHISRRGNDSLEHLVVQSNVEQVKLAVGGC